MKRQLLIFVFLSASLFSIRNVNAQTDLCAGAPALPVNISCVNTAYVVASAFATEIGAPTCHVVGVDDAYFTFVATATSTTIYATTNRNLGISVYTGACGALAQVACVNAGGNAVPETLTFVTVIGTTYYVRMTRVAAGAIGNMTGNICIYETNPVTCGATFTDQGGAGSNYVNNTNQTVTICPSVVGQCVMATFTAFSTEAEFDFLYVYDDNTTTATALMNVFHGTTLPGVVSASSTNATGCLTFRFISDGSNVSSGWSITLACQACPTPAAPGASSADCSSAPTVCNSNSFAGNSSGSGSTVDVTAANRGCLLSGENQSSWYYFSPTSNGNLEFAISPTNGTDDYDFAIWGPYGAVTCPPNTAPVRCSYAAGGGNTGIYNGATDNSEGALGDQWVEDLAVLTGEVYILCIDNFTGSGSPFTLGWNATAGASLDCTPLPIELLRFRGYPLESHNVLQWATLSEKNNDYFTIEKSADGINFYELGTIDGAINSNTLLEYQYFDELPLPGINYYRLIQTDINGKFTKSEMISVDFTPHNIYAGAAFPNPSNGDFYLDIFCENGTSVIIDIFDIAGKLISSETQNTNKGISRYTLRTSDLNKGMYFVSIKEKESKKIISSQALMKN